jgi:MFS family permease
MTSPAEPARLPPRRLGVFLSIVFGISCVESLSSQLLPLTLHRHTTDAFTISVLLALNPFFGFLGQPLAAFWSDRIWTPIGRRTVFLVIAAPVVAACLVWIPFARDLWHVAVLVLIYQFFHDVQWGSYGPLLADVMPAWQRPLTAALMLLITNIAGLLVVRVGLGWVTAHDVANAGEHFGFPLYVACALAQVLFVAGGALLLREAKVVGRPVAPPAAVRFSFRTFFSVLGENAGLRRLAVMQGCRGLYVAGAGDFTVLFATVTLGMTAGRYGEFAGWAPLLAIGAALPLGWLNRVAPRPRILQVTFCVQLAACALFLSAQSIWPLALAIWLSSLASLTQEITFKSFSTEFYPPGKAGQAMGAVQVFFGLGRMTGLLFAGKLIALADNNYRWAYVLAVVCAIGGLLAVTGLRDPRNREAQG